MDDFIPPSLKRFHISVISTSVLMVLLTVVFTFIGAALLCGFADLLRHWRNLIGLYLFFTVPVSLFGSLILALLYPVAFSNEGIYTCDYSFVGKKQRFVRWENIQQVRRFRLFNLAWLRIYSVNKDALSLPLFQSRPAEFLHEIGKFAPADSPIRNFLRPRNT